MLEILGYKTETVASGEEAVKYLKGQTVDLILLDMIMEPGINGRETYEEIVKIHPRQKAIIASGFSESREVNLALEKGVGSFVKKPYSICDHCNMLRHSFFHVAKKPKFKDTKSD